MQRRYGKHSVETSKGDKLLFPATSLTKDDVIAYYESAWDCMEPYFRDRFLTLHRFPDGIAKPGFYHQRRAEYFPAFVGGRSAATASGEESIEHIVVDNLAALVYLVDQGTIAFHGWLSRADKPDHPDRIVFDLDPHGDGFRVVVDCARRLRRVIEAAGLTAFVMTTGSRGLHVVAPLDRSLDFDALRQVARKIAAKVADAEPARFTIEQRKRARKGRLYIDISRNAYGQTSILPYSLRAIETAPVATPLDWNELGRKALAAQRYNAGNLARRLARKRDPWQRLAACAARPDLQSLGLSQGASSTT